MNKLIAGLTLAAGLGFSAYPISTAMDETAQAVGLFSAANAQYDERYCRRLRRACEFKDERGERGEGNCRRYRRECRR